MSTAQAHSAPAHTRCGKFQKVGENLYRYSSSGVYYGVFRERGKLKWKSLKTTDKALAKRRLADALAKASKIDPKAGRMSLEALVQIYEDTIQTFDTKTIQTRRSIAKKFKETWQFGLGMQVADITQSHLEAWLGLHRERLRKSSYNEYIRFLRHLLANAVKSRVLAESPAAALTELKRENPLRVSPTWEQFEAIVNSIRGLDFVDAEDSAELVEFMG